MQNPIMQQLTKQQQPTNIIQQFLQFKQQMSGKDPQAMVMDLLNSGKMTPQQFEQLKAQATEMQKFLR